MNIIFDCVRAPTSSRANLLNRMDNMNLKMDKELWDVLGRLPKPTLSPFSCADVLRKIREQPTHFERVRNCSAVRKLVGASAVAAVRCRPRPCQAFFGSADNVFERLRCSG